MDQGINPKPLDWFSPELLTEFIDELRDAGYNIGISQYIAAHDLILSLTAQNLLLTPDRLGNFLGPILCSSSAEQKDFQERFRQWVDLVETRHFILRKKSRMSDEKLAIELSEINQKSRRLKLALIAILLAFSPLLWMGFQRFPRPKPIPKDSLESVTKTEEPTPTPSPTPDLPEPIQEPIPEPTQITPIPISPDEPKSTLDGRISLALCLLALGVAYFVWRRWWLWRASLFLQRRETTQTPELEQISFQGFEDTLFNPSLVLKTAQGLRHRILISANTLDINKTIQASLENETSCKSLL